VDGSDGRWCDLRAVPRRWARASADGTILDDDEPVMPPSVEVSLDTWSACIGENDPLAVVQVRDHLVRTGRWRDVTVRYYTVDGPF
jgi:hypothetical protein